MFIIPTCHRELLSLNTSPPTICHPKVPEAPEVPPRMDRWSSARANYRVAEDNYIPSRSTVRAYVCGEYRVTHSLNCSQVVPDPKATEYSGRSSSWLSQCSQPDVVGAIRTIRNRICHYTFKCKLTV